MPAISHATATGTLLPVPDVFVILELEYLFAGEQLQTHD
jgi:hypothetical protein